MPRKVIITLFAFLLAVAATTVTAQAETLSWNGVTTYTDGTSIGNVTVTYQAYWSEDSDLTDIETLGSSTTSTSKTFSVDNEEMPRDSVIYFTVKATVNGTDSALASPLSWNVQTGTTHLPSVATNLRMH